MTPEATALTGAASILILLLVRHESSDSRVVDPALIRDAQHCLEKIETVLEPPLLTTLWAAMRVVDAYQQSLHSEEAMYYMLQADGIPVPCDAHTWAIWFETCGDARVVAHDTISDEVRLSTVFTGLDYNFGHGPPLLFETMVFGGPYDQHMSRYATRDAALAGHAAWSAELRQALIAKKN